MALGLTVYHGIDGNLRANLTVPVAILASLMLSRVRDTYFALRQKYKSGVEKDMEWRSDFN